VREEIRIQVGSDALANELASALSGMFTIESYWRFKKHAGQYTGLHCKPTRSVAESLLLNREVLALLTTFDDLQVRTVLTARNLIHESSGRLDPALSIVVHADKRGDEKLRTWGREQGLKIIPIYRSRAGALPPAEILRRNLAQELFSLDPFQVTGPVVNDMDFYGRGNDALELLRQLQMGRIRSLFGLRKVGKTSLINRVIGLARDANSPRVAMIDCSFDDFNKLSAREALKVVAKATKMAAARGYAHVSEALKTSDEQLLPVFDDLWGQPKKQPLAVIFDEVDYITPSSPTRPHWRQDFNQFWREFRVVYQEAQRQGAPLAVLVSGVSSQAFRAESIDGVENAVLHFVPEDYLPPFARGASLPMLKDLERRSGLSLSESDRNRLAETCGDFPYWMRMAGSYLHKGLEVSGRPLEVRSDVFADLLEQFTIAEGTDLAAVALEDLQRKFPDVIALLRQVATMTSASFEKGKLLYRYGLATRSGDTLSVRSTLVRRALERIKDEAPKSTVNSVADVQPASLQLRSDEWAEELATISKRRNMLERGLREFVRVALKLKLPKESNWSESVLQSLPARRRSELSALAGDVLLAKLNWKELEVVISRYWEHFESTFGDKKRFQLAMGQVNERPDAHAKPVDAADLALYRRELGWLEERIA
jgi:hypothetical protein